MPYGCLYDTLETAKSNMNSSLQTLRKDNLNKLVFASMRNVVLFVLAWLVWVACLRG